MLNRVVKKHHTHPSVDVYSHETMISLFPSRHERSLEASCCKKAWDSFEGKKGLEIILHSYSNNNKNPHLSFMTLQ